MHKIVIVSKAINYIEQHLSDKLNLEIVANAVHYSKYYLHRIFLKQLVYLSMITFNAAN